MKYVALLRGIMPSNPNMHGENLKRVFEGLGFTNVHTVIASGNVVFDSPSINMLALEKKIETTLPKELGFTSMTIIRSEKELKALVKKNPFKGIADEKPYYLVVTFFKDRRKEVCTPINLNETSGTQFMAQFEKEHGKMITTRTWKTVGRILKKMEA